MKRIMSIFEEYTREHMQRNWLFSSFIVVVAGTSPVNEVKKYHYLSCASIFKSVFLLLQTQHHHQFSIIKELNGTFWKEITEEVLSFSYSEAVGDFDDFAQLTLLGTPHFRSSAVRLLLKPFSHHCRSEDHHRKPDYLQVPQSPSHYPAHQVNAPSARLC